MVSPVYLYKDFYRKKAALSRYRERLRDVIINFLSIGKGISGSSNWIRFPYYHHVFDDERAGFAKQLNYFRDFGEFISLSEVVTILEKKEKIKGQYFCITFDDGFLNNYTNAVPILIEKRATATFFLPTNYIGRTFENDLDCLSQFFRNDHVVIEFLNWEQCRQMLSAGMEIGSHSVHHIQFARLQPNQVIQELKQSKKYIETNLGSVCDHFCMPFGVPNVDFDPERDRKLVKKSGYKSLSTTRRGPMYSGGDPYSIRRDHLLANWSTSQLRYFFSHD